MTIPKQICRIRLPFLLAALAALVWVTPTRADLLELVNGDHYSGTVIALTRTNLEFQSDIQGLVKIPRDKIASIKLRDVTPKSIVKVPLSSSSTVPGATNSAVSPNPADQTDAVIQQMRQQGLDPNMMNQVQQQILGQTSPEATRMFNDTMQGLMAGTINVGDIRAQAQKAIQDIQVAKKDLGGDSSATELLNGYLGILQKFVEETGTPAPSTPVAKPAPSATPPVGAGPSQ
jgi:hypothetical protein